MSRKYGLSKNDFYKIINVLKKYSYEIEEALIFGSRARGDYSKESDIDIAIKLRIPESFLKIVDDLESINLIHFIDCIDYYKTKNNKILKYIDNEGKKILLTNSEGDIMANLNKIIDKYEDLKKAYKKLCESASRDYTKDDIIIDATIQRFEFTYEISWKLIKSYLEYLGKVDVTSPRSTIKEGFKEKLIDDGEKWLNMLNDRNRTSHTYDEESAMEIFLNIKNEYLELFKKLINELDKKI